MPSITLEGFPDVKYIYTSEPLTVLVEAAEIANRTDDVVKIANNLGIPQYVAQAAKENYWIKERLVLTQKEIGGIETNVFSIGRFSKDKDDIKQWKDSIDDIFNIQTKDEFKNLIAHEYIEGKLIDLYGVNFRSFTKSGELEFWSYGAHDIAPLISRNDYYLLGRLDASFIPKPNRDLTNLDDIVKKIAKFYNLK